MQDQGGVTVRHSTSLSRSERMGLRFFRLDPILMEPIDVKMVRGRIDEDNTGWGALNDLSLFCSTESDWTHTVSVLRRGSGRNQRD